MKTFKKSLTAAVLAVTVMTGSAAPAAGQTIGGEEECSWELVIDGITSAGTIIIPIWHLERTCVKILDDVEPATQAQ